MSEPPLPIGPELGAPEPDLVAPSADARRGRRGRLPAIIGTWLGIVAIVVVIAGFRYHTDYVEVMPGGATSVAPRIHITGAKVYATGPGEFDLLYVREREHLSYWAYLQARFFDRDVSLQNVPSQPVVSNDVVNACDMNDSQVTAKLVALQKLGYKIARKPGLQVLQLHTANAAGALQCNDVIHSVDGQAVVTGADLHAAIARHKPGDVVTIGFDRAGRPLTKRIALSSNGKSGTIIGVDVQQPTVLPVNISIRTDDIVGPSAGLSMTLAVLDALTPGALTGGLRVAVTGTIEPGGEVGGIGGTPQKVVAARRRHAQLFIVGAGSDDLAAAIKKAGPMKVVVVHTLDEALAALVTAGGTPLPARTS